MPQLSPILEVEQDSQRTSPVISDTPPTLQPVTISPYARIAIDTQTHNAQTVGIAHPQRATTQPTISTPAADAHTTTARPHSKITLASDNIPTCDPETNMDVNRDCSILRPDETVTMPTAITSAERTYLGTQSDDVGDISTETNRDVDSETVSYTFQRNNDIMHSDIASHTITVSVGTETFQTPIHNNCYFLFFFYIFPSTDFLTFLLTNLRGEKHHFCPFSEPKSTL